MITAGVDIGSRSIELVLVENDKILEQQRLETSFDYLSQVTDMLAEVNGFERLLVTGYGRHLISGELGCDHVTEIKAHSRGVHFLLPETRTILDIGGQDTKTIALDGNGRVLRFEMNDRCAAGTGRFLEVMSQALGCRVIDLGGLALSGADSLTISSMCTVFAETEVVALRAKGTNAADVALALVNSVVQRAVTMLRRIGLKGDVGFCGGVARNRAVVQGLAGAVGLKVHVPENPDFTGALGAALLAGEN